MSFSHFIQYLNLVGPFPSLWHIVVLSLLTMMHFPHTRPTAPPSVSNLPGDSGIYRRLLGSRASLDDTQNSQHSVDWQAWQLLVAQRLPRQASLVAQPPARYE